MMNGKVYKIYDVMEHCEMILDHILDHFQMSHPRSMILEVLPVQFHGVRVEKGVVSAINDYTKSHANLPAEVIQLLKPHSLI